MPVDIRYCTVMRVKSVLYRRLARKAKIPDKPAFAVRSDETWMKANALTASRLMSR